MKFIAASLEPGVMTLPLFTERCAAGFPSPAADYTEAELDLNEYCIRHRASTYFVRAIGVNAEIYDRFSPFLMSAI